MSLRDHPTLKKVLIWLGIIIGLPLIIFLVFSQISPAAQPPYTYGVTFRYPYAQVLKLDWHDVYQRLFSELHIDHVRIPVYWDRVEKIPGHYEFGDLDYQVHIAQARGAKIILAVGRRVPGWPECYTPDWAAKLSFAEQQQHLLAEITQVVNRYKDDPALEYWQVENEPFLTSFGICPKFDVATALDQEIALVKQLDPHHKIVVTDSGELSTWVPAARRADVFGSTLYRRVYTEKLNRYINYHLPPEFFRAKMTLVHLFRRSIPIINIELQAEPWTPGLDMTSFETQAITYPVDSLVANVNFAHQSGFSTTYLWGVEYWYWAAAHGHPEFLQEAKTLLLNQ